MDPKSDNQGKPSDTAASRAAAASKLEDLLGSAELGVLVRGVVLVVEEPTQVSGTSGKGKPYSFFARRSQVHCGDEAGTVVVSETLDRMEDFKPLPKYREAVFSVEGARMDGRQMVLRGKLRA